MRFMIAVKSRITCCNAGYDYCMITAEFYRQFRLEVLINLYLFCFPLQEVLFILESYVRDFHNLIEWLNLKWSYEQTPPPMRPNALAWEIRKPTFSIVS